MVSRGGRFREPGALPGDLRTHRRGDAERGHLRRVAAEFVADLAADGVVYGEARWAPEQHTRDGCRWPKRWRRSARGSKRGRPWPAAAGTRSWSASSSPRCGTLNRRSTWLSWYWPTVLRMWPVSTSPEPRPAFRPNGSCPPSSTCACMAGPTPFTPARPPEWNRSRSGAGLRGQPNRPRRRDHLRHRPRRDSGPGCRLRPRPADPVGAVSVVQRADRGGDQASPSIPSLAWIVSVSPSPSTVTTN